MSIYKGTQLIAANGAPGENGIDGQNGQGIMIVNSFTELHNNIDEDGHIEMKNFAEGCSWCTVGGYDNLVGGSGQGMFVHGYGNRVGGAQGGIVTGYGNSVTNIGQGGCVEGYENALTNGAQGVHIEGCENVIKDPVGGIHVEGYKHNFGNVSLGFPQGAHLGGYCLSSINSNFIKSNMRAGREQSYIEAIGVKTGTDTGTVGRLMRNDGCMGIEGDLTFTAVDSQGTDIGRYTLGEIVEALIQAGILAPPL